MAFFFVSVNELGRVERCGDTWVATDFFIFNFVPLFPVRSWLHVGNEPRRRIPLHLGSIAIAYARVLPLGLAVVSLFALAHPMKWIAALACLAIAALAYFVLGRLSATEKAKRYLTAEFIGAPV